MAACTGQLGLAAGTQGCLVGATLGLFTGINPLLGMAFGATHAVVYLAAHSTIAQMVGTSTECNRTLVNVISLALSTVITLGLSIGTMALMGLPLVTATLVILCVALAASSIFVGICFHADKGHLKC